MPLVCKTLFATFAAALLCIFDWVSLPRCSACRCTWGKVQIDEFDYVTLTNFIIHKFMFLHGDGECWSCEQPQTCEQLHALHVFSQFSLFNVWLVPYFPQQPLGYQILCRKHHKKVSVHYYY